MSNRYNTRNKPAPSAASAFSQRQAGPARLDPARHDRPATQRQRPAAARSGSDERSACGMCERVLGSENCIGCDTCEAWLHANEMCTGLPHALIKSLLDYGGNGVRFVCSKCRVSSSDKAQAPANPSVGPQSQSDTNGELIKQLFWFVKGICVAIRDLTARLDATFGQLPTNLSKTATSAAPLTDLPDLEHHRRTIREEVREVQEREKRRQSVIIRGLGASSPSGAATSFAALSEKMFGTRVELSHVVTIPKHGDLFRAKILDEELRKLVLTRAKTLKDSEYGQVYIRRDLTYKQREELRNRQSRPTDHDHPATSVQHNVPTDAFAQSGASSTVGIRASETSQTTPSPALGASDSGPTSGSQAEAPSSAEGNQ